MSNELSTKDSEKLAKIRKEAKHNKACIYGAGLTEAFLGGTVIGQIACDIDDITSKKEKKISEVYGDNTLTTEEKEKKVKKITRNDKIRKGVIRGAAYLVSGAYGYAKGSTIAALVNHENDHMNKRIFQVVKPKDTKGSK
jgi:hypothetical protein